jgi:hypothetical protein
MWFKSLWQTFEALVVKMCICQKVRVFCLETFCQNYYLKKKKSHRPNYYLQEFYFYFYLFYFIFNYYLFQFCQVGGSATVHKRSAQIFFSLGGVTGGE